MYNIKPYDYIPEPNPVSSDRIVAAHYYAAWKYGAAQIHGGFNDLAERFPDRTPLMGYYDEENPEVCDWEIKWASEHGVNCFIYCWYRKKENMGKPVTVDMLRCGHGIHEAMFNAKFQKHMKFAIMYEASPRWGGTDPEDMLNHLMPFWMEQYFTRENYLKIDNKPVLFVYQQQRLTKEGFEDAAVQRETFDACREYAKKFGFDGMIFAMENSGLNEASHKACMERGYDFHFGYSCGWSPAQSFPGEEEIIAGQVEKLRQRLAYDPRTHIPTATCFRDSEPRTTQHWIDMGYGFQNEKKFYLSPDGFRRVIREMKAVTDTLPEDAWGRKIFMIDNWNEWDEGHFISPSVKFGFRYLQAIREELSNRDNLPDYRTPQDIGFTGYNKSWVTPDFKEYCEQMRKEGKPF